MRLLSLRLRHASPLLAVAALALGACGSDDTSGTSTAGASGGGAASNSDSNSQDAAQTKLRDCLRGQGIDLPSTTGGGAPPANLDQDKIQAALDGPCKAQQQAATGGQSASDRQDIQDQLTKFASCMRKQGVDVPDPSSSGGVPDASAIDQSDPKVQAAAKQCQSSLPQGIPGGGGR